MARLLSARRASLDSRPIGGDNNTPPRVVGPTGVVNRPKSGRSVVPNQRLSSFTCSVRVRTINWILRRCFSGAKAVATARGYAASAQRRATAEGPPPRTPQRRNSFSLSSSHISRRGARTDQRNEPLAEVNRVGKRIEALEQQRGDAEVVVTQHCLSHLLGSTHEGG
jgi:hypothetical protein